MRRKTILLLTLLGPVALAQPRPSTRVSYGSFEIPTYGAYGTYQEAAKAPNQMVRKFHIENYGVIQHAYDGRSGWTEEPETGIQSLNGERLAALEREAEFLGPGERLAERYAKVTGAGRTTVEGRDAILKILATREGAIEKMAFDAETGALLRIERQELGADGLRRPASIYYGDYRTVDGIPIAHTVRFVSADVIWIVRLKSVAHNVPLDDAVFRRP